jgi:hypothetical protein
MVVDQGAVAFQVVEKTEFDRAEFEKQKETIAEQLRSTAARNARVSLLAKLRNDSQITINEELLRVNAGR